MQASVGGLAVSEVAERIEVDPNTIERWITKERLPHRRDRAATAHLLGIEESYLWPEVMNDVRTTSASQAEIVAVYPHRGAIPDPLWSELIDAAIESVDVLVYAGLFLVDSHADLTESLQRKAERGARARFAVGDPDSEAVRERAAEEGIGDSLASRIRLCLDYLAAWNDHAGLEVRMHTTPLYNSIYRFDNDMLVNVHAYGAQAPQSPVIHLRRLPGGCMFDHFQESFDRVWSTALPAFEAAA